jgi:hypothetical protein
MVMKIVIVMVMKVIMKMAIKIDICMPSQAKIWEDRCKDHHNFRMPRQDTLDYFRMLANYKHDVDGEACYT